MRRGLVRAARWLVVACLTVGMLLGLHLLVTDDPQGSRGGSASGKQPWLHTRLPLDESQFAVGGSHLLQKIRPGVDSQELQRQALQNDEINEAQIMPKKKDAVENRDDAKVPQGDVENGEDGAFPEPDYRVHVFYYAWYGSPEVDAGKYIHWNHPRLPHWDKKIAKRHSTETHVPPDDIGSNFYPQLGAYSSRDPQVIEQHMRQIRSSGAGVLAVSWYPPGLSSPNGQSWDDLMPHIFDAAHKLRLKVCFHIEPFNGRTADTIRQWVEYIVDTYGNHPAFYRQEWQGRELPLYYMYDSYQVSVDEWQRLLTPGGDRSVRGASSRLDGVFIGLLVERGHQQQVTHAGFDGYYTYFASDGFSYGSTRSNWRAIATQAQQQDMLFIPSVGPGYIDDRVRPWNRQNTKERRDGAYYEKSWETALACGVPLVSVTSFNEWHEGTQIEPAVPKHTHDFTYLSYAPHEPDFYLTLTRKWVELFAQSKAID